MDQEGDTMSVAWMFGLLLAGGVGDDEPERLLVSLGNIDFAADADPALPDPGSPEELGQDRDKDPAKGQKDRTAFSIGPVAGYLKARDADRGTWFGGVNMRLRFARIFAIEGSITAHTDSFQDGDIDVVQYPVQVSALLFPIPDSPIEPYGVFGAGWYYTRYEFEGALEGLDDE